MSSPYVGEIRMFGGSFAPAGWAMCAGQLMPISQNETLFNLIGTTYGGDGQETFALPDLQGRAPIHAGTAQSGTSYQIGEMAGVESVTLTTQQMPAHSHPMISSEPNGNLSSPVDAIFAGCPAQVYLTPSVNLPLNATMNAGLVGGQGGSQPHENMGPFLVITFIISLFGIFPSQS